MHTLLSSCVLTRYWIHVYSHVIGFMCTKTLLDSCVLTRYWIHVYSHAIGFMCTHKLLDSCAAKGVGNAGFMYFFDSFWLCPHSFVLERINNF